MAAVGLLARLSLEPLGSLSASRNNSAQRRPTMSCASDSRNL